jgi:hypothetical protein
MRSSSTFFAVAPLAPHRLERRVIWAMDHPANSSRAQFAVTSNSPLRRRVRGRGRPRHTRYGRVDGNPRGVAGGDCPGVSEAGHDCVWRAGGASGDDGGRIRAAAAVDFPGRFSGPAGDGESDSGTEQLGKASIVDRTTLAVFGVSLIALLRFRVNSAWLIAAAAIVGWVRQ